MTKEQLIAMGLSEEDAQKIIADAENEKTKAVAKATKGQPSKEELETLKTKAAKADEFEAQNMTNAEKTQKEMEQLRAEVEKSKQAEIEFKMKSNRLTAKEKLIEAGYTAEQCEKLLNHLVKEDADQTMAAVNDLIEVGKSAIDTAVANDREQNLGKGSVGNVGGQNKEETEKTEPEKFAEQLISSETSTGDVSDNPYIH